MNRSSAVYDTTTQLLLASREQHERQSLAARESRALRLTRLRRLDRRAQTAATRARLLRLALS
jgi:hypothetical protein